ncbi:disease resistance protein RPS5-like [Vicia villosa]|uniref:disease resistance protein RPS5-like n=1 Tax=Vicia villosa TaxID=3911 RepID=UPI00273A8173|nr:disease resistance protein RPS5-like [Vicia villosa]
MINGAIAELRHVFCFTCIVNEFEEEKVLLKEEIKTLEQRAKVAAGRDKDILANVHYWKEKVDKLIQEDIKTKQTCFLGLCADCMWRYKRGKELANNMEEIKHLINKGEKFENIERFQSKDYISFKSRESKYRELMDALLDDKNYTIGLQGIGGIGKTTLAKTLGKELKISEQFTHVIITTMSFTPDTKKIQDDIVGPFGLELGNYNDSYRPEKVWRILTSGEKILLIMDDVWDQDPPLDFDLIGIPKKDSHNGCRVLITTRSKQVLQKMNCDKKIELELLSEEEAWDMFKTYAGINNSFSKKLITKGREIAKECKQLPIAIVVIAGSLNGQQDRKHQWDATLKSLKKTVSMDDVDKDKVEIYKCLKSSYDGMKDEKVKGLFLLSSLFPEDKEISIEILTRLGIGTGLFGKNYGRYNDARNEVGVAIYKLIDLCLMVGVGEEHVKMHDLVREAAQWTAYKEIRCVKLSNKDEKSSVEKEKNMKYLFCEGKYMDLFSWKYDGSKLETLILDVKRDEDRKRMEARSYFFENIDHLQVLYFSSHTNKPQSLPDSFCNSPNFIIWLIKLNKDLFT